MNRICWWLVERLSRLLESNERDVVLGDFAESGESGGKALVDLLGLVVRRQAAWRGHHEFLERLMRSFVGLVIGTGLSFCFRDRIFVQLAQPLTDALKGLGLPLHFVYTDATTPFTLCIKLSTMFGVFLASPYFLWQFWLYFAPGLYRYKKRFVWAFVILASTLFVAGGFFAYKLAVPAALRFWLNPASPFRPLLPVNRYWDLAITIIVGAGFVFELPCVCWLVYLQKKAQRL